MEERDIYKLIDNTLESIDNIKRINAGRIEYEDILLKATKPEPVDVSVIMPLPERKKFPPTINVPTVALGSSCKQNVPPEIFTSPVTDKVELAAPVTTVI